jgi:hypothetical protein
MPVPAPGARYMSSLLPLTPIGCGAAVLMSVHGRQQSDVMPVTLCEVLVVILVARRYAGRGARLVQPAVLPSQGSGRCAFEYAECRRAKCAVIMSSRVGPGDASTAGAGRSSRMPHNRFPHVWVNLETDPAAAAVLGHHGLSPEHSARPCQTWVAQQPRVGFRRAGDVRRRELTVPPVVPHDRSNLASYLEPPYGIEP